MTIQEIISTQNEPRSLTAKQIENPSEIITDFLQNRNLAEHREQLWTILSAAITGNINDLYNATDIGQWVFYFRELEQFIEAVFVREAKV
jgi:hypothetical protein